MGCSRSLAIGPPAWRPREGVPSTPQRHGQATGAGAALTAPRGARPAEGLPADASPAGRRARSPRQAVAGIPDGGGMSGRLRGPLAGATADACGEAHAAPLHRDTSCRTGAASRHGGGSADLSTAPHAGQGTQRSVWAVSLRLSGERAPDLEGQRRQSALYLFESNRCRPYSARRLRQIGKASATAAGIAQRGYLHLWRHQLLTDRTKPGSIRSKLP